MRVSWKLIVIQEVLQVNRVFGVARCVPCFKAVEGLLHPLLVVLDHVCVHVWVVTADVPLCAPVRHRPKPERRIMFLRLLELEYSTKKIS